MKTLELWKRNNPWNLRGISNWNNAMERFFEDNFGGEQQATWISPACDVAESPTHYEFAFDLPGIKKENIRIELHQGQLSVSGERSEEKAEENKKRHVVERTYGAFSRVFQLPQDVDGEKVAARYDNGVLHVSVPKGEGAKARQITVK